MNLPVQQVVNQGVLTTPIPGQVEVQVPRGGEGLHGLAGVIGEVLRIVLFLIGAWFPVGMLVALINGQPLNPRVHTNWREATRNGDCSLGPHRFCV